MSNQTFPSLPGLSWPFTRSPVWKTGIQTTQSGRELRASFMSYPIYQWQASYDVLRASSSLAEFQQLLAFFNQRQGSFDTFLFTDPDDYIVSSPEQFATGDGVTTQFQLVKSFGGYVEPVSSILSSTIYVNGTPTAASPLSNGIVGFSSAPASGAVLTWTGTYQYVCRFLADTYDFDRFMNQLYSVKKIAFISVKP